MPLDRARWYVHSTWMSPPDYIDDDIGTAMLLISMDSVRNLIDALRTRDAYTVRLAIQQECCVYLICLRCNLQFSVIDECTMFSSLGMHWIEWFTRLSLSLSLFSLRMIDSRNSFDVIESVHVRDSQQQIDISDKSFTIFSFTCFLFGVSNNDSHLETKLYSINLYDKTIPSFDLIAINTWKWLGTLICFVIYTKSLMLLFLSHTLQPKLLVLSAK